MRGCFVFVWESKRERESERESERARLLLRLFSLSLSHTLGSSALTHHAELDYSIARWSFTIFCPSRYPHRWPAVDILSGSISLRHGDLCWAFLFFFFFWGGRKKSSRGFLAGRVLWITTNRALPGECVYVCVCTWERVSLDRIRSRTEVFHCLCTHLHTQARHSPGGFGHRMPGTCGSLRRCSAAKEPLYRLIELPYFYPGGPKSLITVLTHWNPSQRTQM